MVILAIETSCDETAAAVLEIKFYNHKLNFRVSPHFDPRLSASIKILSNIVSSQVEIHRPYGGVVPNLAKREHQKNLVPVLKMALNEAKLLKNQKSKIKNQNENLKFKIVKKIFEREEILLKKTLNFLKKYRMPEIDLIAVTVGPGLAPALWPGVNLAKALAYFWGKPILGANHIKGHIAANWLTAQSAKRKAQSAKNERQNDLRFAICDKRVFPAVCLVVSGGHTQLILMRNFGKYRIIGETRDDAAGEAFDKVARLLDLGYPGGPAIAAAAASFKFQVPSFKIKLPRPMINSEDFDFSFSGLKTAVLYKLQELQYAEPRGYQTEQRGNNKNIPRKSVCYLRYSALIAKEFQQAVIDVLISKTIKAAKKYKAKTVILSGGVAANEELRKQFKERTEKEMPNIKCHMPNISFCTDNAAMIAVAGCFECSLKQRKTIVLKNEKDFKKIKAEPNLRIH